MSCIGAHDPQLQRLANAIAQRVGQQRFDVWFINSTRLDLQHDGLEIAVPNDFISEWIGRNFSRPIQEAAHEVLGCDLNVRFSVVPQLFDADAVKNRAKPAHQPLPAARAAGDATDRKQAAPLNRHPKDDGVARAVSNLAAHAKPHNGESHPRHKAQTAEPAHPAATPPGHASPGRFNGALSATFTAARVRHDLNTFVVGAGNQLAYNAALHVAQYPGAQYNPLFIHGACGLGKTHLLQGLCRLFADHHPQRRWVYLTGEEFTNEFVQGIRTAKVEAFRRKVRDVDLLVIDDVHFLSGKKATQEEFLHTFNAIEALGRQVVMASDNHPKLIHEFGESLINRFVSGMVVRIDPPNHATRCQILKRLAARVNVDLEPEVVDWVARRVTQNVRELEGAVTRIGAIVKLTGQRADLAMVQNAMGDLERHMSAPVKIENILSAICSYFGIVERDLLSARRQRTLSLARALAMHLIRRMSKMSFPEIGMRMGKRNHSTVISACKRMDRAIRGNETLPWLSSTGERNEEAPELVQRLEEMSRSMV